MSRPLLALALLGTIYVGTASATRPAGQVERFTLFWKTPGEAAYCRILDGPARIVCWTPNDGFTITLHTTRTAEHRYYSGHRDYYKAVRVLPFGYRVSYGRGTIVCRSATSGLTCTNAAGRGFWLGRYHGFRTF